VEVRNGVGLRAITLLWEKCSIGFERDVQRRARWFFAFFPKTFFCLFVPDLPQSMVFNPKRDHHAPESPGLTRPPTCSVSKVIGRNDFLFFLFFLWLSRKRFFTILPSFLSQQTSFTPKTRMLVSRVAAAQVRFPIHSFYDYSSFNLTIERLSSSSVILCLQFSRFAVLLVPLPDCASLSPSLSHLDCTSLVCSVCCRGGPLPRCLASSTMW